ncbi:MAG: hypothetical protein JO144_09735 [Actinobacteria bacterium]|nr:hypothetical protein [Actinomycetota bacterium]
MTSPDQPGARQIQLAVLTALAGGVLAAGSYLGPVALAVAVGLVQLLVTVSWLFGSAVPGRRGGLVLAVLAAGGADAAVLHWPHSGYSPVLGVLGLAVPAMFVHQLARGVVRTRVVESLADITVLLVAVVALTGLLVLRRQGNGDILTPAVLGAITAGLVAAHFADAVYSAPRFDPAVDRGLPAVLIGVLAGGLVGLLGLRRVVEFAGGRGAFVGAAIAAVACLLSIGAAFSAVRSPLAPPGPAVPDGRAVRLRPVAAALMTLALSTPAAYVLVNALAS